MKRWLGLFLFSLSLSAWSEAAFFQSSGRFVVPDKVYRIGVRVVGGTGGHGASCNSNEYGYPGGPGGYHQTVVAVSPGEILDVYVGLGGEGACGGGGGGGGGGVQIIGADFNIWAGGGGGGNGTGGRCPFCGDFGGRGFAVISW